MPPDFTDQAVLARYIGYGCDTGNHMVSAAHQQRSLGEFIPCVRCKKTLPARHWVECGDGKERYLPMNYLEQFLVKEWP